MTTEKIAVTETGSRYGLVIIIASFLIQAIGLSMVTSFSLFFNPMLAEFGWTRGAISMVTMVNSLCNGIASVSTGILNDRFGPRIVMAAHGTLFGLGFILMSRINTPWQLYLAYGVVSGIGMSALNIVVLATVARWFPERKGVVTGIVKAGAGVGIFVMPLVITALIKNSGWRSTALTIGIAAIAIMVISAQFLRRPGEQKVLSGGGTRPVKNAAKTGSLGLSLREALKTQQFWMLCLVYAALYYAFQAVQYHIVPYAEDAGMPVARAAFIISIIGVVSIAGRLLSGFVGDKWGNRFGFILTTLVLIAALIWLQLASGPATFYVFAGFYGIFHGAFTTLASPILAALFGTRSLGSIFGVTQFFGAVFGGLGGFLTGALHDNLGSYNVAYLICLALGVLALVVMFLIRPVDKTATAKF